jgi:zinc protease
MRELQRLVYPSGHPYRRDRFGTAETVKDIERSDVKDYFENVISKATTLISFAGQFKKDEVVSWASRTFGTRSERKINSRKGIETNPGTKSVKKDIVMSHKTQADIIVGGLACSRTEPDYEPLNLLNVILGELGFMGRLGQRVRDKEGLAYSCTSFVNAGSLGGSWTALAGVNPRNVAKALELMKEEIERVRHELVEEQELVDAKQNQLGSALMELESTEGIARTSHNLAHFDLGLDYFVKRRQLFSKITREDLMSMGKKYLDSSRLSTVIVGPRLKN